MEVFDFKKLKATDFPIGTYLVIRAGATNSVMLSQMKVVVGWLNPILTTLQDLPEPPHLFLVSVQNFLEGPFNNNPFKMAVYEVDNKAHVAAIFGPLTPNMLINDYC